MNQVHNGEYKGLGGIHEVRGTYEVDDSTPGRQSIAFNGISIQPRHGACCRKALSCLLLEHCVSHLLLG